MRDPIRAWNAHTKAFAAAHSLRTFRADDGTTRFLVGKRSCRGDATLCASGDDPLWLVYSPRRVVYHRGRALVEAEEVLEDETVWRVRESRLLAFLPGSPWTKPVIRHPRPDLAGKVPPGFQAKSR